MLRVHFSLLFAACFFSSVSLAATINVPADQPTIQAGVNAAAAGDLVLLAPGLYFGDGNRDIDFGGKDLVVMSRDDDYTTCIIDCQGYNGNEHRGFLFQSGESPAARVQGLTITGGWTDYGDGLLNQDGGGGLLCIGGASPTIVRCRFTDCGSASGGGAIAAGNANLNVVDCWIDHCYSDYNGGAIYAGSGQTAMISGCTIVENGFMGINLGSNTATVHDCVIAGHVGWGISLYRGASVFNSTIANNGSGIDFQVAGTIQNCLIAFNDVAFGDYLAFYLSLSEASMVYTDVFGNDELSGYLDYQFTPGTNGNIAADPLFCDPGNWDYHLAPDSPCLDTFSGTMGARGVGACPAVSPVPDTPATVGRGLTGNYPNPFNPRTTIGYVLDREAAVTLQVFDVAGRRLATLVEGVVMEAGSHQTEWDGLDHTGRQAPAGVYFCVLETDQGRESRPMVMIK